MHSQSARNCDVCGAPLAHADTAPTPPTTTPIEFPQGTMSGPICPVCHRGNRSASLFCAFCGYRLKSQGAQPYALPYAGAPPAQMPGSSAMDIPADVTGNIPSGTLLKRRYRIVRKIAQGGMGAVYESNDVTAPVWTRWAIKEISPAALPPSERTQAVADFRREAGMLATLEHPNLPQVVETFEQMGKHFLAMEFVPGRTLLNAVEGAPSFLPEERVMVWARQLFDVLLYLHAQNPPIIYRDLKPANIMLVEGTERIKLIDFGIARFHKAGKSKDTEAFGTAGYAPPEQYGKGQTDQRSDIYALAATLHHLFTRHDPSLNPFNWLPARRYNPAVSYRVENALQRALTLDPEKRYTTIGEFAEAMGITLLRMPELARHQEARPPQPAPIIFMPPPPPPTKTEVPSRPSNGGQKGGNGKKKTQQAALSEQPIPVPVLPTSAPPMVTVAATPAAPTLPAPTPTVTVAPAKPQPTTTPPSKQAARAGSGDIQYTDEPMKVSPETEQRQNELLVAALQTLDTAGTGMGNRNGHGVVPPAHVAPEKRQRRVEKAEPAPTPAPVGASALVVSDKLVDLGEATWRSKPARKLKLQTAGGGQVKGTVLASQPWIAYNPHHFQGDTVTLEVKVKRSQLHFGRLDLQVPNVFAIIWARTRKVLPFIGCWFWVLLLVASSLGRTLLWGTLAALGILAVGYGLMWLWALHVRLFVPTERLNTGRLLVKTAGGEQQQIEVRVVARPSWLRKAFGWTMALLLLTTELAATAWIVLALGGFRVSLPG